MSTAQMVVEVDRTTTKARTEQVTVLAEAQNWLVKRQGLGKIHGLDVAPSSSEGFFGAVPRVWTYKPERMLGWAAIFFGLSDMTIFNIRGWFRMMAYASLVVLIMHIASDDFFDIYGPSLFFAVNASKFVIGIVIGGFVGQVLSRWYARKQQYGGTAGKARLLAMQLSSLTAVRDGLSAEQVKVLQASRTQLSRWMLLSLELAWLRANGHIGDAARVEKYLNEHHLLADGEYEKLSKPIIEGHTICWSWIQTEVLRLVQRGLVRPEHWNVVAATLAEIQGKADMMQMSMDWDIPYPYAQVVTVLVQTTLFFHAFEIASFGFEQRQLTAQDNGYAWTWICIINANVAAFLCTLLTGFLDLHALLHDPFGARRLDVPHEALFGGEIRQIVVALLTPESTQEANPRSV